MYLSDVDSVLIYIYTGQVEFNYLIFLINLAELIGFNDLVELFDLIDFDLLGLDYSNWYRFHNPV